MDYALLAFYVFAAAAVMSAVAVISVRNMVQAALFLVLTFFTVACTWILAGAEFLGIALVLVYVGAVMVLFLFVVMMLDINLERLREGFWQYLPLGAAVGVLMAAEMAAVLAGRWFGLAIPPKPQPAGYSNTRELGRVHDDPPARLVDPARPAMNRVDDAGDIGRAGHREEGNAPAVLLQLLAEVALVEPAIIAHRDVDHAGRAAPRQVVRVVLHPADEDHRAGREGVDRRDVIQHVGRIAAEDHRVVRRIGAHEPRDVVTCGLVGVGGEPGLEPRAPMDAPVPGCHPVHRRERLGKRRSGGRVVERHVPPGATAKNGHPDVTPRHQSGEGAPFGGQGRHCPPEAA